MVILDIMLPILDGWEVCKHIRSKSNVPIIIITAKSDELSNLKGYNLGVDDYICKPFSPKVLVAKVNAVFARLNQSMIQNSATITIDDSFIYNELSHEITVNGIKVNLTATEFSVLSLLIRNMNIVLKRNTILDNVWGENYFGDYRIVDTNIKRIREKLGCKAHYIQTVRSFGYKFTAKHD